jgi:hypothetical protein
MPEWIYFADGNQAIIRLPASGEGDVKDRPGERYWGPGGWSTHGANNGIWTAELARGDYRQVSAVEVPAIIEYLDTIPGTAYRDQWRFWPDQAHRWTIERARTRAARLDAETGPDSDHWTVQSYFDDVHELERLQEFIGGA